MPTLPSGSSYPATSKQRPISSLHIYPHHSYPFIYISYINGKRLGQLDSSENHKYRKVRLPTLPSASSYLTTSCLKRGPITPLHNAYHHQPSCCSRKPSFWPNPILPSSNLDNYTSQFSNRSLHLQMVSTPSNFSSC